YVINDIGENNFYYNSGNGHFVEATKQVGLSNHGNGMGVDICDYNNDGLFDIYVTNIHEYVPNPFFVNQGNGAFKDLSEQLGIEDTGWGWGARFFDADHDLDEDLYVVNGFDSPIATGDPNKFFENGNGRFTEVSSDNDLNSQARGMGLEVFDFDMDGDQDMVVANREAQLDLYRNNIVETNEGSNWIQIKLEGIISNKNGFGARVKITCDDVDYFRYHSGVNIFSQSIKPIHYGLSHHQQVDQIQVDWPNGRSEIFGPDSVNQIITLVEGTGEELARDIVLSTTSEAGAEWKIYPNPYKDQIWLQVGTNSTGSIQFSLWDIMGKTILNKEFGHPRNGVVALLSGAEQIPPGLYFYSVKGTGLTGSGKLVKR
ncbi:MAG: FG-GAP-like repeat-containing protein, partial [Cyclobacteriaceae bacterium]